MYHQIYRMYWISLANASCNYHCHCSSDPFSWYTFGFFPSYIEFSALIFAPLPALSHVPLFQNGAPSRAVLSTAAPSCQTGWHTPPCWPSLPGDCWGRRTAWRGTYCQTGREDQGSGAEGGGGIGRTASSSFIGADTQVGWEHSHDGVNLERYHLDFQTVNIKRWPLP